MKRTLALAVLLLAGINTASAAIVTGFSSLLIGTKYYDVTIHTTGSFNSIWDIDGDGTFGEGDASVIDRAPTFWGDFLGAFYATQAVMTALGADDAWSALGFDGILTPYGQGFAVADANRLPLLDNVDLNYTFAPSDDTTVYGYAHVSYVEVDPVPLPAAVWLFGSALAGLGFVTRKRKCVVTN